MLNLIINARILLKKNIYLKKTHAHIVLCRLTCDFAFGELAFCELTVAPLLLVMIIVSVVLIVAAAIVEHIRQR